MLGMMGTEKLYDYHVANTDTGASGTRNQVKSKGVLDCNESKYNLMAAKLKEHDENNTAPGTTARYVQRSTL